MNKHPTVELTLPIEGYEFLMQNYVAGDKICIFGTRLGTGALLARTQCMLSGFSRGAYTARALAGMLHKVCTFGHTWQPATLLSVFSPP